MSISEESIKNLMKNPTDIELAEAYLKRNKVDITLLRNFWKDEATIKGEVEGNKCNITIFNGQISGSSCECRTFVPKGKICCHIGALALAHIRNSSPVGRQVVYTSKEAESILRKCRRRAIESYKKEDDVSNIGLSFDVILHKEYMEVDFYITNKRQRCRIDNLSQFEEGFRYGISMGYGTGKMSILHELESFRDEFRPMVLFILKSIRKQNSLESLGDVSKRYKEPNNKAIYDRRLRLVGYEIDEFMELCHICSGKFRYKSGDSSFDDKREISIVDSNPSILVRIEPIGNAGYKTSISGISGLVCGEKRIYVMKDSYLYMANEDYSYAMREFLTEAIGEGYSNRIMDCSLIISKKDMPAFSNLVIANIRPYCNVMLDDMELEDFEPWDLESYFKIKLDKKNELIICNADFGYKGKSVDIYNNINEFSGICRDYRREAKVKTVLSKYFKRSAVEKNQYYADEYKYFYGLLKSGISELEQFGEVEISEELLGYNLIDSMKINANVSIEGSFLKLDIDAGDYSMGELEALLDAYKRREKFIRLENDTIVKLDSNGLELLAQMAYDLDFSATDIINKQVFIPRYRALYIDGRLRGGELAAYDRDVAFKTLVRTIKQVEDSAFLIPEELEDVLRGYQKHGFLWLRTLDACGFGGILADDMGLGKTLQIIALLLDEKISVSRGVPSLIIAPASLVYNWENEIKKFAKDLKSVAVVGTKGKRREILEKYNSYDVLITSYELLKRDAELYENISFRFQVIDEAQCIKNYFTENAKCVKKIKAQTRFALTGTPIENRLSELWSIFDYLMPGFLYTYPKFWDKFEKPITVNNEIGAIKGLNRMISPFVLRRLKKDVLKELPEKVEYDVYAKLEGKQHKLYVANAIKLREELENTTEENLGVNRMQFLAKLMNLRQICCDPALCYSNYDGESSKLNLCIDMVKNGISGGHKILIFSQFTSMLDIIAKSFDEENISYYKLTGDTSKEKRIDLVDRFNNDDTSVFLISLKAGGVGLNLTGADMVIHYDPWWNIAAENQASDRAHRIGQNKEVSVFKLISKGTIEENIRQLQRSKAQLADNILSGETISLSSLSKGELLSILNN